MSGTALMRAVRKQTVDSKEADPAWCQYEAH